MKFNKKQKLTLITGAAIITAALLIWFGFGGEVFTKTEILVERQDELLGTSYKEWQDKFILGLDYTVGFIGSVFLLLILMIYIQRDKRRETK